MKKLLFLLLLLPALAFADTAIQTHTRTVQVDLDGVDTSAYAVGDVIDEKFEIANIVRSGTHSGIVQTVTIHDADAEGADLKLVLFDADPGTVGADNAAFDPTDTALEDVVCVIDVVVHHAYNDNGTSVAENVGCAFQIPASSGATRSTSLYGVLVSAGTPTYTAATDLKVQITVLQD